LAVFTASPQASLGTFADARATKLIEPRPFLNTTRWQPLPGYLLQHQYLNHDREIPSISTYN
jgi:hypothetical protein